MENRFGVKDLFLFLTLFGIIGLLVLALVQYDRQWDQIQLLKKQTSDLTNDLTAIRQQLAEGVVLGGASDRGPAGPDPFAPIRAAEKMEGFARGDWFVENFGTNIGKLTPLISTDVYATWVQVKVCESLAYRDPDTLKYIPMLATGWEISPDGKTMTFDLRRGVVFSDGIPMTAADVVFTFEHIQNPKIDASRARAYFEKLESVTAEGDHRVVFKWKEFVFNAFSSVVETSILAKHFYEKFTPEQYNEIPGLLIGTGPYRLPSPDGWRPGQRVELVRNERYWGVRPAFDRLVYHEVKDDVAEETMYRNRELDRFAPTPEQFEKLKDEPAIRDRSSIWQFYSPVSGYSYLGWNQRRGGQPTIFADKRVRQALTMLIDRERLARDLYYGHAKPAAGPFGFGSPQTDPSIQPWPYDPQAAVRLLNEAGFRSRGNDPTLYGPDGRPMRFTLSYGSGNPFTDRIVLYVKDAYAKAGIQVDLDAVDWPILLKRLDTRDFDACTLGWSTSIETDPNQIFHSSQTRNNGDNFINYINTELDAAIDAARSTVDEAERMKKWNVVHQIIHEDQPYTFLLNRQSLSFIDSRVQNIRTTTMGLNHVLTELMPLPWFVPSDRQMYKTQ